jgi:hypothetical protein
MGHYELDNAKTCPNIDIDLLRGYLGESDDLIAIGYLNDLPTKKEL